MSDEEKKAIEYWQYIRDTQIYDGYIGQVYSVVLLNLIEKQSKEIEELKVINQMQKYRIEVIDERELISKDKIKAFIKEELPDDEICSCCKIIDVNGVDLKKKLQSLLEKE